jgi:hypothetical protein
MKDARGQRKSEREFYRVADLQRCAGDADEPPNLLLGGALNGRFWAIADKSGFWPGTVCPLMTRQRHGQFKIFAMQIDRFALFRWS